MAHFANPAIEKDAENKKLLNTLRDLVTTFEEIKKSRLTDSNIQIPENIDVKKRIFFTIKEFWEFRGVIELSPVQYQRFFRADTSWQQQFIKSFFVSDVIIPEIALRFGRWIPKGEVEVMDGCQRMSTVMLFKEGKLCLPDDDDLEYVEIPGFDYSVDLRGKNWAQLTQPVRDYIDNYELQSQVYYDLTPSRAGEIFVEVLNNQNTLVHQEKRQAISSAMSRWVQDTARFTPTEHALNEKACPSVFELVGPEKLAHLKWFKPSKDGHHTKLGVDQCLAEIVYMTLSESWKTKGVTAGVITEFYKTQAKLNPNGSFNDKHLKKVLTLVNQSMRQVEKANKTMNFKPFRNFSVMVSELMKADIKVDPIDFMNCYLKAMENLNDKSLIPENGSKTVYQALMGGNDSRNTKTAYQMVWKEMSRITYKSTQLDPVRDFTRQEVEDAYWKQDKICAICGHKMPAFGPEIHGDHVMLYKDGGPTTPDNCDAVHASCNLRRSS